MVAFAATILPAAIVRRTSGRPRPDGEWRAVPDRLSALPTAIGIAILKHRLYDIDLIINRTLSSALTACVVGLYVLVVGYLGQIFRTKDNLLISLIATGLVAVIFTPLRERLQKAVNRLMYGERDRPYAVLSRLGQRLEATLAPEAALRTIVETIAQALKLPYAAITLEQNGGVPNYSGARDAQPASPSFCRSCTEPRDGAAGPGASGAEEVLPRTGGCWKTSRGRWAWPYTPCVSPPICSCRASVW